MKKFVNDERFQNVAERAAIVIDVFGEDNIASAIKHDDEFKELIGDVMSSHFGELYPLNNSLEQENKIYSAFLSSACDMALLIGRA